MHLGLFIHSFHPAIRFQRIQTIKDGNYHITVNTLFITELNMDIVTEKHRVQRHGSVFTIPAYHENPFQNVDSLQIMNGDIGAGNIYYHTYCWKSEVVKQHQMEQSRPYFGSIMELHACNLSSSVAQPI